MTLKEAEEYIASGIAHLYDRDEARSIAKLCLQHHTDFDSTGYILNYRMEIDPGLMEIIEAEMKKLKTGTPIQYITGNAHFYGYDFKVSPAVLIPRRETEELVEKILHENKMKEHLNVLDIGTGSGCIAITLKKKMKNVNVFALDISRDALLVAEENAKALNAEIRFINADILEFPSLEIPLDIIVSNPPYILESEKIQMHKNVLENEPHIALFVPENDPLLYYRSICQFAQNTLNKGGKLYFEINERMGDPIIELLSSSGFTDIKVIKDMQGKDRMASAIKS
jgi:release factor glutamine methyltransferase